MADLILRAQTLIDGTGADPVRDAQVAIRDGRIHAVGTAAAAPDGPQVVDYGDATIMPGLIDAHVHLQFTAADEQAIVRTTHERASDGERITTAIGNAQRALATGVTTLRDTGGYLTLNMLVRDGINAGHVVGPRLLVCGAPITTTAGHLHWCGLRADSADEIRNALRRMIEAGADFIKVMATGGMMTPGSIPGRSQYTREQLEALVSDAHRLGKHVAAHVLGADGCALAIDAGVDTLEHCSWLTDEGVSGQTQMDADAVGRIDPSHQSVHMTIAARNRLYARGLHHLDQLPADQREQLRAFGANHREMRAREVPMVVSSDAGVMLTRFDEFPLSVVGAVVALDLTPVQAIQMCTQSAAGAIGIGDLTGTLAPGRAADVLVVRGDAAENICSVTQTQAVYLGGREVARERRLLTAPPGV